MMNKQIESLKETLEQMFWLPARIDIYYSHPSSPLPLNELFNKSLDEVIYSQFSSLNSLIGSPCIRDINCLNPFFSLESFPLCGSKIKNASNDLIITHPFVPYDDLSDLNSKHIISMGWNMCSWLIKVPNKDNYSIKVMAGSGIIEISKFNAEQDQYLHAKDFLFSQENFKNWTKK